ncbi:MAG: glycosyltransferase family 4 protein [Muribaculaceae bacterium]
MFRKKIIRTSTVSTSLNTFCRGTLRRLAQTYDVVAVSTPDDELKEMAQREGVRAVGVAMRRPISPLHDLRSLLGLIRVFRRERPYMVHSITPKAGLLSMIAAWVCRVPVRLHTFTGLVFPTATGLKKKILMLTDRITCACATHIVPEGEGVKNDLINYVITRKPLRVLGYGNVRGVDMQHYNCTPEVMAAAKPIMQPEVFTFVFVGRVVRDKGINELVQAFARLHAQEPATRLILVGRFEDNLDPVSPQTRQTIEQNEAIEAVGSQADVRPWLAASDALVFPSYREGFPNVVLEAGAMGLPSIVTDINGSREIIVEGKNGTIVPPRDADALYAAMLRFIEAPAEVAQMAANARDMIASRFEKSFAEQCLFDYYKEILQDK